MDDERSYKDTAQGELGGHVPDEPLTPEQERAFYDANIGSKEMRRRVERVIRLGEKADELAQDNITRAEGAGEYEKLRETQLRDDAARGIDVNSSAYLAKQRLRDDGRVKRGSASRG